MHAYICMHTYIHTYTHISFRRSTYSVIPKSDIKLVRKNTTHKQNKYNTIQYNTINKYQYYSLQNQILCIK